MSYVSIEVSDINCIGLNIANDYKYTTNAVALVGFFLPCGSFYVETETEDSDDPLYHRKLVNYLNGGNQQ